MPVIGRVSRPDESAEIKRRRMDVRSLRGF
jgi:hypothetical protein